MEEVFRTLVGRLNESVRGFLSPRRKSSSLPIQVSIKLDSHVTCVVKRHLAKTYEEKKKNLSTCGETHDISEKGLSFIVPFIRLGEHYLVSEGTILDLEIDLPNGKLRMQASGCRYEQINENSSVGRFLVGAKIVKMTPRDKALLEEYLVNEKRGGKVKNVAWGLDLTRP